MVGLAEFAAIFDPPQLKTGSKYPVNPVRPSGEPRRDPAPSLPLQILQFPTPVLSLFLRPSSCPHPSELQASVSLSALVLHSSYHASPALSYLWAGLLGCKPLAEGRDSAPFFLLISTPYPKTSTAPGMEKGFHKSHSLPLFNTLDTPMSGE